MKIWSLTLTLLVFTSLAAFATKKDEFTTYIKTSQCAEDAADLFDPSYALNFGEFKGKCLDTSTVRPPVILNHDDQIIEIANFYHNGRFWIARLPKNQVVTVIFQGVPFGSELGGFVITAHGQLRLQFSTPVELRSQSGTDDLRGAVSDIIISSTITKPRGIGYSVTKGTSYGLATRFLSTTARSVEEVFEDQSNIHQYKLDLTPEKMNRVLLAAVIESNNIGYFDRYGLLRNNCATQTLDMLDAAIPRPPGVKPFKGSLLDLRDVVEKPALEQLKLRNIKYTRINDLNTEVLCAEPGDRLAGQLIKRAQVGKASAVCKFKSELF